MLRLFKATFSFFISVSIVIIIVATLISGIEPSIIYGYSYIMTPSIHGASESEYAIIKHILNNTDKEILHHITSITVTKNKINCGTPRYYINGRISDIYGCTTTSGGNPIIRTSILDFPFFYSDILIASGGEYLPTRNYKVCGSFENTLQHEIGHVKGHIDNDDGEIYAEDYAYRHTIDKGDC